MHMNTILNYIRFSFIFIFNIYTLLQVVFHKHVAAFIPYYIHVLLYRNELTTGVGGVSKFEC